MPILKLQNRQFSSHHDFIFVIYNRRVFIRLATDESVHKIEAYRAVVVAQLVEHSPEVRRSNPGISKIYIEYIQRY